MSALFDAAGNPVSPKLSALALPKGTERPVKRVLVAIPSRDDWKAGFGIDLVGLVGSTVKNRPDIEMAVSGERGTYIVDQRHHLAQRAVESGADYILWLDSDMRFPKDALVRLLAHGQPIVAANYVTRTVPPQPVTHLDDRDKTKRLYTTPESTGLVEVAAAGMGVMLTSVEVFQTTPKPWFGLHWVPQEDSWAGEDVWLCRSAREQGFKVMIDQDLSKEVLHLGELPYDNDMARPED
jgi:hypothetical protein